MKHVEFFFANGARTARTPGCLRSRAEEQRTRPRTHLALADGGRLYIDADALVANFTDAASGAVYSVSFGDADEARAAAAVCASARRARRPRRRRPSA